MKYEPASTLKLATVRPTAAPPYHELTAVAPMNRVKRVKGPLSCRGASSSVRNKAAENTRSPRAHRAHHPSAMPIPSSESAPGTRGGSKCDPGTGRAAGLERARGNGYALCSLCATGGFLVRQQTGDFIPELIGRQPILCTYQQ